MGKAIIPVLVGCQGCPDQYVILPEAFFSSIGFSR
jgi:hypothetical protein